jgi:hypothetical protein
VHAVLALRRLGREAAERRDDAAQAARVTPFPVAADIQRPANANSERVAAGQVAALGVA